MAITRDIAGMSKMMTARMETSSSIPKDGPSTDPFHVLLKNMISGVRKTVNSTNTQPSLNQDQLTLLVRAIQIQMNSRLYNTIFNNGLEANDLAAKVIQDHGALLSNESLSSNKCQPSPKKEQVKGASGIEHIIQDAAKQFGVDENLIRSVIKAESNFNSNAVSSKGAMGLMQLMPDTARELGVKNAYDPHENVIGGTRYLKMLLDRYNGQVDLALAAYNWGMGNLEKRPHNLPQETVNYVDKVNAYYKG